MTMIAKRKMGTVYFLRCPTSGLIKIGWTSGNPASRLLKIRGASPVPIESMATTPGPIEVEREYHLRFQDDRDHCEWFRPSPDLLAEIATLDPWTTDSEMSSRRHVAAHPSGQSVAEWALMTNLTIKGVTKSVAEWCELAGIRPYAIKTRLRLGKGDHHMLFGNDLTDYHFMIRDKKSPEYLEEREKYYRWKNSMTTEEWETYRNWGRKANS